MNPVRKLYWLLRYEWRVQYFLPLLLFLPLIAFWQDPFDTYVEAGEPVTAKITSLAVGLNKYQGRTPGLVLTASTPDGAMGTKIVFPNDVAGCKVGDDVRAEQVGFKLFLQPAPCKR